MIIQKLISRHDYLNVQNDFTLLFERLKEEKG